MAHRLEHRPVRGARYAAGASVRALPGAAVLLTLALAATARADSALDAGGAALRAGALPSLGAWWAEPGRPGGTSQAWLVPGSPAVVAGHALGGIALEDEGYAAPRGPWPGLVADARPLVWSDSLVTRLEPSAGPGGALVHARASRALPGGRRARAVFGYVSGDAGVEETTLLAERGDAARALRAEVESSERGAAGSLGNAGRHAWGLAARTTRGAHRLEGAYAQRGAADELARLAVSEAGAGESGRLHWSWQGGTRHAALTLARAYDARSSFGTALTPSRRDAAADHVSLEAGSGAAGRALVGSLAWTGTRVRRAGDAPFDRRDDALWAELRATRPAGGGTLEAALGAAHASAVGGGQLAPSLTYRFAAVGARGSASLARVVTPVWSDLAVGQEAFLQRTWAGSWDVALGEGALQGRFAFLGGITHDRALVARLPITDWWLRQGARSAGGRSPFALALASARWATGALVADLEGFALAHDDADRSPDPGHGARASFGVRRALFGGDLRLDARGDVAAVGPRAVEGAPALHVPGYVTAGATVVAQLADATFTIRMRGLEDRPHEEPWLDPATGAPARGLGRELRFALTWAIAD